MTHAPAGHDMTVFYDADCGFCIWAVAVLLRFDSRTRLGVATIQDAVDGALRDVPRERVLESFHAIDHRGDLTSGGAALTAILRLLPAVRWAGAVTGAVPRWTDRGYRWIADHRGRLARLVPESWKARARPVVAHRRVDLPSASGVSG